jgi:hypothetical protein
MRKLNECCSRWTLQWASTQSDRRVHSNRTTRTLEYRFARKVEAAKRAVDAYGRGFCAALVGSSLACNGWIKAQVKAQISGGMPSNYICILASSS